MRGRTGAHRQGDRGDLAEEVTVIPGSVGDRSSLGREALGRKRPRGEPEEAGAELGHGCLGAP